MDFVTSFGIELVSGLLKSVVTAFVLIVTIVKTKGTKRIILIEEKSITFETVLCYSTPTPSSIGLLKEPRTEELKS